MCREVLGHARLGGAVEIARGLVEDQDVGLAGEHASDRQPLALATRQRFAAPGDERLVAYRHRLDLLVQRRQLRTRTIEDSGSDGSLKAMLHRTVVEDHRLLHHHAALRADRAQVQLAQRDPSRRISPSSCS